MRMKNRSASYQVVSSARPNSHVVGQRRFTSEYIIGYCHQDFIYVVQLKSPLLRMLRPQAVIQEIRKAHKKKISIMVFSLSFAEIKFPSDFTV